MIFHMMHDDPEDSENVKTVYGKVGYPFPGVTKWEPSSSPRWQGTPWYTYIV